MFPQLLNHGSAASIDWFFCQLTSIKSVKMATPTRAPMRGTTLSSGLLQVWLQQQEICKTFYTTHGGFSTNLGDGADGRRCPPRRFNHCAGPTGWWRWTFCAGLADRLNALGVHEIGTGRRRRAGALETGEEAHSTSHGGDAARLVGRPNRLADKGRHTCEEAR